MTDNMKKFLELASTNDTLASKLNNASKDDVIALAKEQGIELTEADFEAAAEVSDDELNTVAGGKQCYCAMGGGGTGESSNHTKTCACVLGGHGGMDNGDRRCVCIAGGYGDNDNDLN